MDDGHESVAPDHCAVARLRLILGIESGRSK